VYRGANSILDICNQYTYNYTLYRTEFVENFGFAFSISRLVHTIL
jgi:hypothetical protein